MTALKYYDPISGTWKFITAISGPAGPPGADGADGPPGQGVPPGGATGHVLNKKTATDYDTQWSAPTGGSGLPEVHIGVDAPSPRAAEVLWMDSDEAAPLTLNIAMDTWHVVGAAGEPVFGTNWSSYGGSFLSVAFRKDPNGRVAIRGLARATGLTGASSTIFTLPVGYRPSGTVMTDTIRTSNAVARIDIGSGGQIVLEPGMAAGEWVTLDGIEFDTDSVLQTASVAAQPLDSWHLVGGSGEPAFTNSWKNYDNDAAVPSTTPGHRNARFRKYPNGKVRLAGIIKTGASGTVAFTLPAGYRPNSIVTYPVIAWASSTALVSIDGAGIVVPTNIGGNVTNYVYLDGVEFDTESVSSYASGFLGPPKVTALPANPIDGQECYYVANATDGVIWHLRYNAGSASAYKWEFVGGPPLTSYATDGLVQTTSQTPVEIGQRVGVTIPLAGDYMVNHGCSTMDNLSSAYAQARTGLTTGGTHGNVVGVWGAAGGGVAPGEQRMRVNALPAAAVLIQVYNTSPAGTARFSGRHLDMVPVRVG